jgi:hypothetical protein
VALLHESLLQAKNKITHLFQMWFRHQKSMLNPKKVTYTIFDRELLAKNAFLVTKNVFIILTISPKSTFHNTLWQK